MRFLLKVVLSALGIMGISYLLADNIQIKSFEYALLAALVIGFLNAFIRPIVRFLTLPITVVTLGLFLLVVNALMIMAADYLLGANFVVSSFWYALLFSLLYSLIGSLIEKFVDKKDDKD
jgi:putative membrane protein